MINNETSSFKESMTVRRELRKYLKQESIYSRAIKPYTEADLLLRQAQYYSDYDELAKRYTELCSEKS